MLRYSFIIACFLCVLAGSAYLVSNRAQMQTNIALGRAGVISNMHQCRWPLCPYKGIDTAKADRAIANYVGAEGTDAYYIDKLHIKYPDADYDTLDSLLTH